MPDAETNRTYRRLALVALLVRDYDEAIGFFVDTLGFRLDQDTPLSADKRWVVVVPSGGGSGLLLAKAANDRQASAVGDQSGGRVFLFLETDDFERDRAEFQRRGVRFVEEPRHEAYGKVAVFVDLHGNRWGLVEPSNAPERVPAL